MKKMRFLLWFGLLPSVVLAQKHSPTKSPTARFVLPVRPNGRVTYLDTARAPGASAEQLLNAAFDAYAKNFMYFDYPISPADTFGIPRPRELAGPGEQVFIGSTLVFDPQAPPPVYVPGISPPLDPRATYPALHYVTFTVRLRPAAGRCAITITDLRLRQVPYNHAIDRLLSLGSRPAQTSTPTPARRPAGQPAEARYARWLPNAPAATAATTTAKSRALPDEAEVRRLDDTLRGVVGLMRRRMESAGASGR